MERRQFLQGIAGATTALRSTYATSATDSESVGIEAVTGTLVGQFTSENVSWRVYENFTVRNGDITFASDRGERIVLSKSAEPAFAGSESPYFGLALKDIGMSPRDLLADKILASGGDPDPNMVKAAAPPIASAIPEGGGFRLPWDTIVGTRECKDTMPVFPSGNTRTYHPVQYFPELTGELARRRLDGLVGGWMPLVRKVMPVSESKYFELLIFGNVEAKDEFIVQTWHRSAEIENGKIIKVVYGYSYPAFPPAREDPPAEQFYRALFVFHHYWRQLLSDACRINLPDVDWSNLPLHAFAKEQIVRPGGVYPKYGAVDRDYYGSEYDGFQDIFTSSVYANLEWGRFDQARAVIDNYFTSFVDDRGAVNMRGPETGQYGLTLSLLARYFLYTGDSDLLRKYRKKIAATADILVALHDESLRLPSKHPGHGLIHGWSESDSCLMPKPNTWWKPYFGNSAFAARGLQDLSRIWTAISPQGSRQAEDWLRRSAALRETLTERIQNSIRRDMNPPYIGPLPGVRKTFLESIKTEHPSEQGWPHRAYSELLQADVLPADLANIVIDTLRAYGGTTLGVVANVERPHPDGRDILGFISYGYAQMLLRLDRVEEYLLFLYSHRYHVHTRGSWVAGEVTGITGDSALFCIPAQMTIPLLVRWMLVLEHSDEDRLYLGKGVPRQWLATGQEISIAKAPTRWGRIDFTMRANMQSQTIQAHVRLGSGHSPGELEVTFRVPAGTQLRSLTVNGAPSIAGGRHSDTVLIRTQGERAFEIAGGFA